ncbi:MAG TPA: hypothetical protein VFB54_14295 [Burkholderiales bacterium]|nr:hypothetical protein [Burkholderiales bacterium]
MVKTFVGVVGLLVASTAAMAADTTTQGSVEVRDWAAIDTNKDNLISPDEMQKYLESRWNATASKDADKTTQKATEKK